MEHHIAILPAPGIGHLIPLVELAKRLLMHQLSITFFVPTDAPPSKAQKLVFESIHSNKINHIFLPPPSLDDLPQDTKIETRIALIVARSLPSLREALKPIAATKRLVALVVDLFGTDAFDVATEFNVSPYIFFPSTAMALSLFLLLPKLDETVSCEYRDLPEPVEIPGCVPVHGRDFFDPVQDRRNDVYKWILHHAKRYRLAEGIMVNSFNELEGGALNALKKFELGKPPVYPVGPLVNMGGSSIGSERNECLKWLDSQPLGSVLYVSFGSGGTLSFEQITELALGLEANEQRFLWVVRSPDVVSNASFFTIQSQTDPFDFLPKGFLDRTRGRGVVVSSWAPQAEVLSHDSTGGFLTHCGWNSILESVVNGVPLITWPLYAEQKMNAVMLSEDIKVALRPKTRSEDGIIGRDEIAKVVKDLMEGEEGKKIRNRMKELKEAAAKVVSEDGSSTMALSEVTNKWKNKEKI
ncbi:hydroquinone glucosyltransferase [Tripterygium wilfordii]|uniref:Glycosyltransferase n=1 Tax=Tripterygium wilfordii TaxID=458696 RepID=A0A7J7DDL4_TRIWF|nr:hydroquinone glucosyltransferase-like [Tripterygium wilfordii]KAF5744413.1 hydroquinone glucosyltransferase [Tripterygium wilfordii]